MPRIAKTLILTSKDIYPLIDMRSAVKSIAQSFAAFARQKAHMPPKVYLDLSRFGGDFRAMPAWDENLNLCSLKWVNAHPLNQKYGLPSVMAVIILNDPRSAFPLAIMDGTLLTSVRTGAAGGVAVKYLSKKSSRVLGLVGCGRQALTQIEGISGVRSIEEIRLWDISHTQVRKLQTLLRKKSYRVIVCKSIHECTKPCDIVVSTTPSRKALIPFSAISPGTHINAIGADAPGKQELDIKILKHAKIVIDAWEQACHSGEINVAFRKKILTRKNVHAEIGQIVAGQKKGRTHEDEITVFDSTGLAIQDTAVAGLIYRTALKKKKGTWMDLISLSMSFF